MNSEQLYLELLRENERLRNLFADGKSSADFADNENLQLEVEERRSLRRVVGISTELEDISIAENRQLRLERVVLVGVWTQGTNLDAENSLRELAALAETAGSQVLEGLMQRRDKPDSATFIGSGKVAELREVVAQTGADTVICDGELSPSQLRQLEERVKVKVVDRTALILDIFAQHAKSREGKAQVELAQISYLLPRLRGWGDSLSRQVGGRAGAGGAGGVGIGGRGPGETKIEVDRRRIRDRMTKLRREIKEMKVARETKRQERDRNSIPSVAIAGYTNAGKSSLLNRLTGADVLVENALFATLDPTTRRTQTGDGRVYTFTDTVGFVRHLPHQLVDAFKSTLEEVENAALIVHVVDGAHPDPREQMRAVREVIDEIGAGGIPEIIAINKSDIADPAFIVELVRSIPGSIAISAQSGFGMERLVAAIEAALPHPKIEINITVPYSRGDLIYAIHESGEIFSEEYVADGTLIHALVNEKLAARINLSNFT